MDGVGVTAVESVGSLVAIGSTNCVGVTEGVGFGLVTIAVGVVGTGEAGVGTGTAVGSGDFAACRDRGWVSPRLTA